MKAVCSCTEIKTAWRQRTHVSRLTWSPGMIPPGEHIYIIYDSSWRARCMYVIFGREVTNYTVICGVYIQFWSTLCMFDFNRRPHSWFALMCSSLMCVLLLTVLCNVCFLFKLWSKRCKGASQRANSCVHKLASNVLVGVCVCWCVCGMHIGCTHAHTCTHIYTHIHTHKLAGEAYWPDPDHKFHTCTHI
jgi:hypothetical protein